MKNEDQTSHFRFRLLPNDSEHGWTPYAWLIYLGLFIGYLPATCTSPADWALSIGGIALFLVLYFTGYWLRDRRTIWVIAGIASIGVILAPNNPGACVFFIYAGAFAGFTGPPRLSAAIIVILVAVLVAETWIFDLSASFWVPGLIFTVIIGGVNSHFSEAARIRAQLQRAEEEIEHLAQLAERERIARDLHDLLGHTLSLITLKSELAAKLVTKDPDKAKVEILDIEHISRNAMSEVRQTVSGYRATGFEAELANCKLTASSASIAVRSLTSGVSLKPHESHLFAHVLREATTNIIRHSGASEISVELEEISLGVRLSIADNGRGFEDYSEGHGLSGMRQRLKAAGGTLTVSDDNGVRLVADLHESDQTPEIATILEPAGSEAGP